MSGRVVLALNEAVDLRQVGGKAAALARLIGAGFEVPPGFVVTVEGASAPLGDFGKEVIAAYEKLGAKYVSVRSSAVAEDGAKDAWAGQLDTYLNVTQNDLMTKIHACLQSANSERAKAYAEQKGLQSGKVAVIVQAMIQSDAAGIAFSVNPVSINKTEMIIEAGFGLNEPIVSGEVTPDTYVIDKSSLKVLQKHISEQTKKLSQAKKGQNAWQVVNNPKDQKISEKQIAEVAKTVQKLEKFFGIPVDVEWTYSDGKLFILQTRPITTLG